MDADLYLDTARLGRMCRGARLAEQDFGRLVGRLGSSLYLEQFLADGFQSLPNSIKRGVPRLSCWHGVAGFRRCLAGFIQQPLDCPAYFFGQSSSLIGFAARCLYRNASRVLTTDLAWPAYADALNAIADERGKSLHVVPLKSWLFTNRVSICDVVQRIKRAYQRYDCDGLFLSDISYLGIRLPLVEIMRAIGSHIDFCVIDGAQAFNQRPIDLSRLDCDLYLTGTQKWLCSYHPLRIAVVGRYDNMTTIKHVAGAQRHGTRRSDALFNFCQSIESSGFASYGETVNISSLIAAAGAVDYMRNRPSPLDQRWQTERDNAWALVGRLASRIWRPLLQNTSLQSGILLLSQPKFDCAQFCSRTRRSLANRGVIASTFPGGIIRLSMPSFQLTPNQLSIITRGLAHLAA
jgi:hypothetical protein